MDVCSYCHSYWLLQQQGTTEVGSDGAIYVLSNNLDHLTRSEFCFLQHYDLISFIINDDVGH